MNIKILFSALALSATSLFGYWLAPPALSVALLITLVFSISYIVSTPIMMVFVGAVNSQQQFRLSWAVALLSLALIFITQGLISILTPVYTLEHNGTSILGIPIGLALFSIGLISASKILKKNALHTFSQLLTTMIVSAVISRLAMHYVGELQMYVALSG